MTEEITSLLNLNQNLTSDKDIKKKIIERMQNHIMSLENVCNNYLIIPCILTSWLILVIFQEIKQNTQLLQKQNNYYETSNKLQVC